MGIVPNRSASPREVHQALWRNLFRSNQIPNFHFGLADEAELVRLADARSAHLNMVASTGSITAYSADVLATSWFHSFKGRQNTAFLAG